MIIWDACSSGLDLQVTAGEPTLDVVARWRPSGQGRAAAAVLRARARLLLRAVLLQYPALWRSQQRGRAPLHASVCGLGAADRPDGDAGRAGRRRQVDARARRAAAAGPSSTCDNLCVSDGQYAWGVVEPLRLPAEAHGGHGTADAARPPGSGVAAARGPDAARTGWSCWPAAANQR